MRLHGRHQHARPAARGTLGERAGSTCRALDEVQHLVAARRPGRSMRRRPRRRGVELGGDLPRRCSDGTVTPAPASASRSRRPRGTSSVGATKRCPRSSRPEATPATRRRQHVGAVQHGERADRAREAQRLRRPAHVLRHLQALDEPVDELLRERRRGWPSPRRRRPRRIRRGRSSAAGVRPWRRANPSPAFVQPSVVRATFSGGPRCSTRSAACRPARRRQHGDASR